MTREQQRVLEQAIKQGLVKDDFEACELGCAVLRQKLQDSKAEREAAEKAKAEAIAALQGNLF